MRKLPFIFLWIFSACLLSQPLAAQIAPFPTPTGFVKKDDLPPPWNLPERFQIPAFTQIDVAVWHKALRSMPAEPTDLDKDREKRRLLWAPDLMAATVLRDAADVQMSYQWEGNTTSKAYQISGITFWLGSLKYPNSVIATGDPTVLSFSLNSQGIHEGSPGDFPGLGWYSTDCYVGHASLSGKKVLVFVEGSGGKSVTDKLNEKLNAQGYFNPHAMAKQQSATAGQTKQVVYVDADTMLPAQYDSGQTVYNFSYKIAPGAKISPEGAYAKTIDDTFKVRGLVRNR